MSTKTRKMCMIGDFGVGKTSLIRRFVDRQFSDQYLSTVGVKISRKTVELLDQQTQNSLEVKLLIWDIEGQTKFKAIAPSYLQGAAGMLIVADMTRQDTVEHLINHIELCLSVNSKAVLAIGLNKTDLVEEDELERLIKLATAVADNPAVMGIYQTSAKTGLNVDIIFENLSEKMFHNS
jgi:small GTP-binding protein